MTRRYLAAGLTLIAVVSLLTVAAIAQVRPTQARTARWAPSKTAWGDPDLQGIWNNVTATPLQRPNDLKDKALLTREEAAEFARQAAEREAASEAKPTAQQTAGQRTGYASSIWFAIHDRPSSPRPNSFVSASWRLVRPR